MPTDTILYSCRQQNKQIRTRIKNTLNIGWESRYVSESDTILFKYINIIQYANIFNYIVSHKIIEEMHSTGSITSMKERIIELRQKYDGTDIDLGYLLCDHHIDSFNKVALVYKESVDHEARYTFKQLKEYSTKFAAFLSEAMSQS